MCVCVCVCLRVCVCVCVCEEFVEAILRPANCVPAVIVIQVLRCNYQIVHKLWPRLDQHRTELTDAPIQMIK